MQKLINNDVNYIASLVVEGLHNFLQFASEGYIEHADVQHSVNTVCNALTAFMQTHNTWELHNALTSLGEGELFADAIADVSDFCC